MSLFASWIADGSDWQTDIWDCDKIWEVAYNTAVDARTEGLKDPTLTISNSDKIETSSWLIKMNNSCLVTEGNVPEKLLMEARKVYLAWPYF